MPMGLFLLIGAGFAISRAFDVSGLSVEIGLELSHGRDGSQLVWRRWEEESHDAEVMDLQMLATHKEVP